MQAPIHTGVFFDAAQGRCPRGQSASDSRAVSYTMRHVERWTTGSFEAPPRFQVFPQIAEMLRGDELEALRHTLSLKVMKMSSNDEQDEKERLSRAMMPEMQRLMLEAIEALTSRVTTNETETRKRMEFIIEHQAAFATGIQQLQEQQAATVERMAALENLVTRLAAVTHTGFQEVRGSIAALVDAQMHTDENLKNLIAVADRYFSEGRNGGNGSNGQA